ncbi:TonB-dependent receptor [Saccharibacter sp. 17.LH.SD]|uniref:TonB-dependent receptor n=1 Tax=Saccharibacter sp. 17.LH.SD TaxID=2689393 RepID=UPI001371EC70|nr:TonB-dependent receptor [Saccharibacter sp. 17.LH.SD]MXV45016.1 TonB-dependent receptor [Saccharibacter sp. 17.LH.SD]
MGRSGVLVRWWYGSLFSVCLIGNVPFSWADDVETIRVTASRLDRAREALQPSIGATQTHFSRQAIEANPGGDNAGLNSVLLQAPGVTQDSYGQLHIRGDHNNIQFRLDGVALPEGVSVFGQALMTRFAHDMSLTTGVLPAQYGFRQAGVIDLKTKNGFDDQGATLSLYGGARDYLQPSVQYGGHRGKWDGFFTVDAVHNRVGIENTTSKFTALHDLSNQYHILGHLRYTLRPETRFSLTAGVSNAWYQLPNNPGQQRQFATPFFKEQGISPQAANVDSSALDEHQQELTDFAILSWQENHTRFSAQTSAIIRYSSLRYSPDLVGDLVYNGIAQRASRSVFSSGVQNDSKWKIGWGHILRAGFQAYGERNTTKTDSLVYPVTDGLIGDVPMRVHDGSGKTGVLYGAYVQDEWSLLPHLTLNTGLRFDGVREYVNAHQLSPRITLVWEPWRGGRFHAGYARYFTPPPFETLGNTSLGKFADTSAAPENFQNDKVKAERDHYFDAGFMQEIKPGWHVGFDAYLKRARNMIDEGQFGAPVILTAYNYRRGKVHGYELTTDYTSGPLTLYGSMAWSRAMGKDITSAQWNFDSDDLAYMRHNWVHLDHDQRWTASAGGNYSFFYKTNHPLQLSASMVYGSGLRKDRSLPSGSDIPNGASVPNYVTFNLSLVQTLKGISWLGNGRTQFRVDVINLFDKRYMLRDGSGIGVGAPQYGLRRTIMGGISYTL